MNNEIGRKITSLTLMTIMVAGGMTFAMPGVLPEADAATANLFVSAENSLFDNSFAGPMVIEVVVNDPDLKEIDEAESEPDVTVNGKDLRMAQADDGNWYGYFADDNMALAADRQVLVNGTSLDFGLGCTATSASAVGGASFTETVGVYFPQSHTADVNTALNNCATLGAGFGSTSSDEQNVIRENKTLNDNPAAGVTVGQINAASWPAIQLYDFTVDGTVEVKYNKGGSPQQIDLVYLDDADGYAGLSMDRTSYPQDASVHFVITDLQLNIDPTDEDSWTFATNSSAQTGNRAIDGGAATTTNGTGTHYQVFDENGGFGADTDGNGNQEAGWEVALNLANLNFDDNGVLILDIDTQGTGTNVLTFADNNDQQLVNVTSSATAAINGTQIGGDRLGALNQPVTIVETQANSGIFKNTDEGDTSNVKITSGALRGTTGTVDYNDSAVSVLVKNYFGTLTIDDDAVGGEWNSGEEVPVTLVDQDQNKNSLVDEDLDLNNAAIPLIPSVRIGSPITLGSLTDVSIQPTITSAGTISFERDNTGGDTTVQSFSDRLNIGVGTPITYTAHGVTLNFSLSTTTKQLANFVADGNTASIRHFLNYDLRSLESNGTNIFSGANINITIANHTAGIVGATGGANGAPIANDISTGLTDFQGLIDVSTRLNNTNMGNGGAAAAPISIFFNFTGIPANTISAGQNFTVVLDLFRFGQTNDGVNPSDRFNDAIYRLELEESGDNTGTFIGSMEYQMLNQININQTSTFTSGIDAIDDEIRMIVQNDLTDEDSIRINYLDLGADGVSTQIADQVEAPTHSGVVSFDSSSYKIADTVVVTLEDQDLNTDVETIDIFTVVSTGAGTGSVDAAFDTVGVAGFGQNTAGENFGRVLDITFDDELWRSGLAVNGGACTTNAGSPDDGLGATGFTLVETSAESGVFTGDFQIPSTYCSTNDGNVLKSVTGTDLEVNYVDFRDASGEIIEVGDSAGIRANTGSVSLDRTVYPVPFGVPADFGGAGTASTPSSRSVFPIHQTGMSSTPTAGLDVGEFISNGDLTIHVRVNDPDFDVSASGEDNIAALTDSDGDGSVTDEIRGPVKITVSRGADKVILATAGGPAAFDGKITVLNSTVTRALQGAPVGAPTNGLNTVELGPINEVAPDAGIFELDMVIRYTDGPSSATCPTTTAFTGLNGTATGSANTRFTDTVATHCILQGDIITVEYTDPTDASGDPNTVTDSATFDLRNGVLQSDKSVYIIGSDMILTLIEPDFDLENDEAETYDLDLIEWDSDAATTTMGNRANTVLGAGNAAKFDPEPSDLRETGDSTGIFQIVIEIPQELGGDNIERGEEIVLEYTDWGPSGSDYVGDEDEDVNLTIFTSNFGATVELDQKVYSWTDKVYITIVAPDHNFDSDLIDEIGNTDSDPIKVSTRGNDIDNYRLVETGTDTGIFTGEVILTGFAHDADGDGTNDAPTATTSADDSGPTDGFLESDDDDGITVSFEFSEDETVVGSALIRWNIGEVQWLEASYPASGTGVVRVVDPDMNLDPESVDNFDVDVWSDSDAGGIDLTVTETNEATGIFEGTVFFTIADESSGHRLRVAEGDTITAEYEDNTLPDPYTTADELDITGTSLIGTVVPPLERAPAANARVVDAFGNSLSSVSVDQQVQITADLANGQDREQSFAYLVQVQDGNGVTVSLAWITGSLSAGQSFSPALSWIPDASGSYTATVFVWESVDNPTALSPPVTVTINVQ